MQNRSNSKYDHELWDLALLDGLHEQVVHLLLGGILGQEQDIEAGVSGGKPKTLQW